MLATVSSNSSSSGSFLCTGLNGGRRGQPNAAFSAMVHQQQHQVPPRGDEPDIVRMLHMLPVSAAACSDADDQLIERLRLLHDIKGFLRQSMVDMYPEAIEHIRDERIARLVVDERPMNPVYAPMTRAESENCMVCREMVPEFSVCSPRANGCNHCRLCELCLDEWVLRGSAPMPRCPGCRGPLSRPAVRLAHGDVFHTPL